MHATTHMRAILYALGGFALWVLSDSLMKFIGEVNLPFYQIIAFLGFFGVSYLSLTYVVRGRISELWPKNPRQQVGRSVAAFACAGSGAVALHHLPLTLFYVVVFVAPMLTAILASVFLNEKLGWQKVTAIVVGFAGVVIAIDPLGSLGNGDWIGYAAAVTSASFFAVATVLLRFMNQNETPQSMMFMTGLTEALIGFTLMFWYAVPMQWWVVAVLAIMGLFNILGNLLNCHALRLTEVATVEQFHYTQIITGALIGYLVWHEVPTLHTIIGAAIIVASGLYVATMHHPAMKSA